MRPEEDEVEVELILDSSVEDAEDREAHFDRATDSGDDPDDDLEDEDDWDNPDEGE